MTQVQRAGLEVLAKVVGDERAHRLADTYRNRILVPAEAISYRASPRGRRSRSRLLDLADRYAGKRCFIIGNGPSLAGMDLRPLRREHTFGLNRGYLLFDRIGGPTSFMVAVNDHVVRQFGAEIATAGPPTFLSWRARRWMPPFSNEIFVRRGRPFAFSSDIVNEGAWEGATVTFAAMQIAFHLGFQEVFLIGVDHSFATAGPPNKLVTSQTPDPNHFDPRYFGPGIQWQLPDLEMSETAYRLAKQYFEDHGRVVVDATVNGKLAVFQKKDYGSLFTMPTSG